MAAIVGDRSGPVHKPRAAPPRAAPAAEVPLGLKRHLSADVILRDVILENVVVIDVYWGGIYSTVCFLNRGLVVCCALAWMVGFWRV